MIEIEKNLICSKKHNNQKIVSVIINQFIPPEERLLCSSCIEELDGQFHIISFNKAKNLISSKQEKLQEMLNGEIKKTSEYLNQFKQKVDTLKSNIIQQLDSLIKTSGEWDANLMEFKNQKSQYNLLKEIENLDFSIKYQKEILKHEFNQFNYSYYKKIECIFQIDGMFQNIISIKQSIDEIQTFSKEEKSVEPLLSIQIRKYNEFDTPHLTVKCQKHNCEVTLIDLNKGVKKEDRMKCIKCSKIDCVTVEQFSEQWNKYQNNQQQQILNKFFQQKKKLEEIKQGLYTFILNVTKIIKEVNPFINNINQIQNTEIFDTSMQDQLISMTEQLIKVENREAGKVEQENDEEYSENYLNKLCDLTQQFNRAFKTLLSEQIEQINQEGDLNKTKSLKVQNKISYKMLSDSIKQLEVCQAISFNFDGSIMAATFENDIKIWKFQNGILEKTLAQLKGHTNEIYCLVYSKSKNWIASAGQDQTVRFWKDMGDNQWNSSEPGKKHKYSIYCLLMSKKEDELISGSHDKQIIIWKINFEINELNYEYSLDKHQSYWRTQVENPITQNVFYKILQMISIDFGILKLQLLSRFLQNGQISLVKLEKGIISTQISVILKNKIKPSLQYFSLIIYFCPKKVQKRIFS